MTIPVRYETTIITDKTAGIISSSGNACSKTVCYSAIIFTDKTTG